MLFLNSNGLATSKQNNIDKKRNSVKIILNTRINNINFKDENIIEVMKFLRRNSEKKNGIVFSLIIDGGVNPKIRMNKKNLTLREIFKLLNLKYGYEIRFVHGAALVSHHSNKPKNEKTLKTRN